MKSVLDVWTPDVMNRKSLLCGILAFIIQAVCWICTDKHAESLLLILQYAKAADFCFTGHFDG